MCIISSHKVINVNLLPTTQNHLSRKNIMKMQYNDCNNDTRMNRQTNSQHYTSLFIAI